MNDRRFAVLVAGAAGAVSVVILAVAGATTAATPLPGPGFGDVDVTASTPVTEVWAAAAVDLEVGVVPSSANVCISGDPACVDAVVAEMSARLDRLGCAHSAPFAFTYLEMTRGVARRLTEPGFFADPEGLAQLDALFARFYFDAFDNWAAGRHDEVPGAWQMAFGAADARTSSAAADLLLGMNAHISRDLAFTVGAVLDSTPDLAGDAADFTSVNTIIAEVRGPLIAAAAERFDPSLADLEALIPRDAGLDPAELIGVWRDQAFSFGRRLAEAPTAADRRAVAAEIERNAVASAAAILNADAVFGRGLAPDERLAHCRAAG